MHRPRRRSLLLAGAVAALAARTGDWTASPVVLCLAAALGVLLSLRLRAIRRS